ncbi:hypothetical protein D3C87_777650 [compost metagenome]
MSTENTPLTLEELAEARELFAETAEDPKYPEPCAHCGARWIEPDPDGFKDYAELSHRSGCKADKRLQQNNAARSLVPRLLATADALTQRAERAELDLETVKKSRDYHAQQVNGMAVAYGFREAERDEAIAAKDRAEGERDALAKFKAYVHKRLDDMGIPVDPDSPHKAEGCRVGGRLDIVQATIALADARGRALTHAVAKGEHEDSCPGNHPAYCSCWVKTAKQAICLTAPEALRQQQEREAEIVADNAKLADELSVAKEREAGKDALITRLREGVSRIPRNCSCASPCWSVCWQGLRDELLTLTPPQALCEREERVAALERVAEIARGIPSDKLEAALAELDARKEGR